MTIIEAHLGIGRTVIYTPFPGCDLDMTEVGVITSVGDKNVFVRYGSDLHTKATCPADLHFDS